MSDAIRARIGAAAGILDDLDGLLASNAADRLPPLIAARLLVQLDGTGRRLVRIRRAVADSLDDGGGTGRDRLDSPGEGVGGLRGIVRK